MPLTVGTAGHIDHGKTSLVEALTGKNTDRLPEEHERGISIDLGYAPLELPDGTQLSVVDVPGHERFVRTMVAGATGIDLFLLVIDANEGARPQTHEHLAILRLLGIQRGVVALTKSDLVDEETLELAGGAVPDAAEEMREVAPVLVRAQSARRRRVPETARRDLLEDAIARERAKHAMQGVGVRTGLAREVIDRSRPVGEPVRNAKTGKAQRAGIVLPDGFEFGRNEVGRGWSNSTGALAIDLADSYAHWCELHFNRHGRIH